MCVWCHIENEIQESDVQALADALKVNKHLEELILAGTWRVGVRGSSPPILRGLTLTITLTDPPRAAPLNPAHC